MYLFKKCAIYTGNSGILFLLLFNFVFAGIKFYYKKLVTFESDLLLLKISKLFYNNYYINIWI